MLASVEAGARISGPKPAPAESAKSVAPARRAVSDAPPIMGLAPDDLDARAILLFQRTAGNASVADLLATRPAMQRAPAPAPAAAPAAPPAPPTAASSPEQRALIDKLHNDSRAAAHDIREILTGNTYLGSRNQAQIMAIVRPWAQVPAPPGKTMSGMDWLIAGLRQNTYEVGTLVKQTTSAFDELFRRMSSDNVAEFQQMVTTSGRQFKNDKPIELATFEVSQEDIIRGLKAGGELAAAVATGGGSIIWQIASWLIGTLPGLWSQIKAVFGLMDAIKAFKSAGIGSKFSPAALGALAVSAIFGKLQGLPVLGGPEPPKADESAGEASGLTKVLMTIVHGITVVKNAYNKVAGKVNGVIKSIDLSATEFLQDAATVYAGVVHAMKGIGDPGSILQTLGDKLKETVGGFFGNITGHIGEVAGDIKTKLELIVSPVKLLGLVADRLVSTVLNFIITHPPSALVQTVFQVIQTASGKELIQVVRDQLKPVGDEIIAKIANSDVVQTAIGPLKGPVHKIADAVGRLTEKGLAIVKQVQEKVGGFLNVEKLREMIHLGPSAAPAPPVEEAAAQGGDFLSVVKGALHFELLTMGTARLAELAKKGAKWAWEKVKSGAKAAYAGVKGAILGDKIGFKAAGQQHELWAEAPDGAQPVLMVASVPQELTLRMVTYRERVDTEAAALDAIAPRTPPQNERLRRLRAITPATIETIGRLLNDFSARAQALGIAALQGTMRNIADLVARVETDIGVDPTTRMPDATAIYEALGAQPPPTDIRANDAAHRADDAHTVANHIDVPLDGPGRSIQSRIFPGWPARVPPGAPPRLQAQNWSYRWFDDATANQTINAHLAANWDTIRSKLAVDNAYDATFNAGAFVGEGYANQNQPPFSGAPPIDPTRLPKADHTRWATIRLRLPPGGAGGMFILTSYPSHPDFG